MLLALIMIGGWLSGADTARRDADVLVFYEEPFKLKAAGFLRSDPIYINCGAQGARNLCDVLWDQVLAGYRFRNFIEPSEGVPSLWQESIRDVSCERMEFTSETIEECLKNIYRSAPVALGRGPLRWRPLSQKDVNDKMYPEGYTLKWRVVSENKPRHKTFWYEGLIMFKGKREALLGSLCTLEEAKKLPKFESILDLKQKWECYLKQHVLPPLSVDSVINGSASLEKRWWDAMLNSSVVPPTPAHVPNLQEFLDRGLPFSECGIGLLYFPKDGSPCRSALFDVAGVSYDEERLALRKWDRKAKLNKQESLFDAMQNELLRGYAVTRRIKSQSVDPKLLRCPEVRNLLSGWVCFQSDSLCYKITEVFKDFAGREEHTIEGNGWGDLRSDHFAEIGQQTWEWGVRSKGCLEGTPSCFPGALFVLIQGEQVVLQASSISKTGKCYPALDETGYWISRDSLAYYNLRCDMKEEKRQRKQSAARSKRKK